MSKQTVEKKITIKTTKEQKPSDRKIANIVNLVNNKPNINSAKLTTKDYEVQITKVSFYKFYFRLLLGFDDSPSLSLFVETFLKVP